MSNASYKWLMQNAKPAHRWLFITITLGIISGFLIIAQSALLAFIIDRVYLHHFTRALLTPPLLLFLSIIITRAGINYLREIISFQSAKSAKESVRKKIFTHLMQLSPIDLGKCKTGALTATLVEQVEALHGFFADYLPQMTIAVLLPFIILSFVFFQNWVAGLILLFTAPLIPLFMALIGIGTAKLNQENFQTLSGMSAHFLDILQGLTTLTLFNRAHAQTNTIATVSNTFREKTMRILRIAFLSSSALELFSTLSIAIIAVYLGLGLLGFIHIGFDGVHISLRHALFILLLAPEFFMPLRQLGTFYHARAEAMGAAQEIINVLNSPALALPGRATESDTIECIPLPESSNDSPNLSLGSPDLSLLASSSESLDQPHLPLLASSVARPGRASALVFKNISFSYHNDKKIISNFNLSIRTHESIGIVGPSGVGKSTLLHLIAKFITPTSGKILVNDNDLNKIDDNHWRKHIALLHQNTRLFHGTMEDNIRFAKPDASREEIIHAAEKSGVMHFVHELPDGLNTQINEQNGGLSGGQIQRVALARIILKNAPIILLDEPTAFLDAANVRIVMQLLQAWHEKKTIIIATHDLTMMNSVERVIHL